MLAPSRGGFGPPGFFWPEKDASVPGACVRNPPENRPKSRLQARPRAMGAIPPSSVVMKYPHNPLINKAAFNPPLCNPLHSFPHSAGRKGMRFASIPLRKRKAMRNPDQSFLGGETMGNFMGYLAVAIFLYVISLLGRTKGMEATRSPKPEPAWTSLAARRSAWREHTF